MHCVHMAACRTELAKHTFAKRAFAKRTFRPWRASASAQEKERRAHTHAIEPQNHWFNEKITSAPPPYLTNAAMGRDVVNLRRYTMAAMTHVTRAIINKQSATKYA